MNQEMSDLEAIRKSINVINGELGDIAVRLAVLENQMSDVLWLQRLILGAVLVAVIGAVIIRKKNNK